MKTYAYIGKTTSGQAARGTLRAESEDEARKRLLAMGVAPDIITEPTPGKAVAQTPLFIDKRDDAEAEDEEQEEEIPEGIRQGLQAATAAFQKLHEYSPPPPVPTPVFSRRARRQSIILGESSTVMSQAKLVLDAGGKVVHAVMHPDAKGKMQVLLVIETGDEQ